MHCREHLVLFYISKSDALMQEHLLKMSITTLASLPSKYTHPNSPSSQVPNGPPHQRSSPKLLYLLRPPTRAIIPSKPNKLLWHPRTTQRHKPQPRQTPFNNHPTILTLHNLGNYDAALSIQQPRQICRRISRPSQTQHPIQV